MSRKYYFSFAMTVLISLLVWSWCWTTGTTGTSATIVFDRSFVRIDDGWVLSDEVKRIPLQLRNNGFVPVSVTGLVTSCPCVSLSLPEMMTLPFDLRPGGTVSITAQIGGQSNWNNEVEVTLSATGVSGRRNVAAKSILAATFVSLVNATPQYLTFGNVTASDGASSALVDIWVPDELTTALSDFSVTTDDPCLHAEFRPLPQPHNISTAAGVKSVVGKVNITFNPAVAPSEFRGTVGIQCGKDRLRIPVAAFTR